jgi:hypothetical protein
MIITCCSLKQKFYNFDIDVKNAVLEYMSSDEGSDFDSLCNKYKILSIDSVTKPGEYLVAVSDTSKMCHPSFYLVFVDMKNKNVSISSGY